MGLELFEFVDSVIAEPIKFKAKLAIGEDVYASLRLTKSVRKYWDLIGAAGGGAAVANTSLIAGTFFAPQGILGTLGLATAVTPLGWVVAAAVVSGGAWCGVMHLLQGATDNRVTVIPKFINSPIDALAASLFDLMAPLALKIALQDGHIDTTERKLIQQYFVREWGYAPSFVDAATQHLQAHLDDFSIKVLAERLAELQKTSPDCNYRAMSSELMNFLRGIIAADGIVDEREELALERIEQIFKEKEGLQFKEIAAEVGGVATAAIRNTTDVLSASAHSLGDAARRSIEATRSSELANCVARTTQELGGRVRLCADDVLQSATTKTYGLLLGAKDVVMRAREKPSKKSEDGN